MRKRLLVVVALLVALVLALALVLPPAGNQAEAAPLGAPSPYDIASQVVTRFAPSIDDRAEASMKNAIAYAIQQYEYPCRQKLSRAQSIVDQLRSVVSY